MSDKAALAAEAAPSRLKISRLVRRGADAATLRAHALAVRLDRVPETFGEETAVDETDARAVRAEWVRLVRAWADYSPEEVFALKAGALGLAGVLALLLVVVAVI